MCVVQVVKLLLQYGSNISDRNLGGLNALDLAKEENIKELLRASLMHEQPCEALAQYRQAGELPSTFHTEFHSALIFSVELMSSELFVR